MKLVVIKNKNVAFSGFIRNVINLGKYDWILKWQKSPLRKIPKNLIEKVSTKNLTAIKKLKRIHDKEWLKYKKKLTYLQKLMKKLLKI